MRCLGNDHCVSEEPGKGVVGTDDDNEWLLRFMATEAGSLIHLFSTVSHTARQRATICILLSIILARMIDHNPRRTRQAPPAPDSKNKAARGMWEGRSSFPILQAHAVSHSVARWRGRASMVLR